MEDDIKRWTARRSQNASPFTRADLREKLRKPFT